jgi:hypothetical protein
VLVLVLWVVLASAGTALQTGTTWRVVSEYPTARQHDARAAGMTLRGELVRVAVQVVLLVAALVRLVRPELVSSATDPAGLTSAYAGFVLSILTLTGRVLDFRDRDFRV